MECSVEGCPNPAHARGWCNMHYVRWSTRGDPGPAEPERVATYAGTLCAVPDCQTQARRNGLCDKHEARRKRTGNPLTTYRRRCAICSSPRRDEINLRIYDGEFAKVIGEMVGLSPSAVGNHIRFHLGMSSVRRTKECRVCSHPDVDDIDEALEARKLYPPRKAPPELQFAEIANRFGLPIPPSGEAVSIFKNHMTPGHQQRRALYELGRLNALKETA